MTWLERPARAANIALCGEMPDSAYDETQWLVQRDGAFLQLSEALYRIVEAADGRRTLDEIALIVAARTRRDITADIVRQLVERQLAPAGLIAGAGPAPRRAGPASPLALQLRMRVLGPRVVGPVARAFATLYVPAIAVATLAATVGSRIWLYGRADMGDAFVSLVERPWIVPLVFALIVASAAFHELGHAAALSAAGGTPRGIGAGLYLIYPVFYTDVTDAYRLPRWRRVLVDLGGFYFNLIFSVGLLAAHLVTGEPALLVAIALVDLEILHQAIPLGRLDGYWLLADLTGIPDPIAAVGPLVRRVLRRGDAGPRLKRSAATILFGYLAFLVPALALFLIAVARLMPRVAAIALGAFLAQADAFEASRAAGDLARGLAAIGSGALLLLPLLAMTYVLFTFARAGAGMFMRLAGSTRPQRFAAALSGAVAVAVLAALWLPARPFVTSASSHAVDPVPHDGAAIAAAEHAVVPADPLPTIFRTLMPIRVMQPPPAPTVRTTPPATVLAQTSTPRTSAPTAAPVATGPATTPPGASSPPAASASPTPAPSPSPTAAATPAPTPAPASPSPRGGTP